MLASVLDANPVAPQWMTWRQIGGTVVTVATIQTKNVPDDVHQILRKRAAAAGQSLQEYVLGLLVREAEQPTLNEILDRVEHRTPAGLSFSDAAAIIRAERDSR